DGFGASAGLQTERSSTVVYQIEFDITPAPIQLELPLTLAPLLLPPARNYGQIGVEEMIADTALIGEAALEAPRIQVAEEQAADARGLVAMLEEEIPVAPLLVLLVDVGAERCARLLGRAMPVQDVFGKRIVGR